MNVLVLGDVMLDRWQTVDPIRVSPEAPVLVARHQGFTNSAGGAGNAAVNCAHLGARTTLLGLRGLDEEGGLLEASLQSHGVITQLWPVLDQTTVKHRIIDTLGRHLVRVDYETYQPNPRVVPMCEQLRELAQTHDVLFISDYSKGCMHEALAVEAIRIFHGLGKFIVVNGKPATLRNYVFQQVGPDVIVLNRDEAERFVGWDVKDPKKLPSSVALKLNKYGSAVKTVVVTLGSQGLAWASHIIGGGFLPALPVDVADVAGAGDTICATLAVAGPVDIDVLSAAVKNAALVVGQRGTSVPPVPA
jgi:D-beta-D-heptose 7-phosphate kinase/D-beta-D-heptose 1-phosphate adenosyltransferase